MIVNCAYCDSYIERGNRAFPGFCSERCRERALHPNASKPRQPWWLDDPHGHEYSLEIHVAASPKGR